MRQAPSPTFPSLLTDLAALDPSAIAVIDQTRAVTRQGLVERARQLGGALVERGIGRGSRVGLLVPNRVEWLEILFGCGYAGATAVPFSTWSTARELDFLISDSGIDLLFVVRTFGGQDFFNALAGLLARPGAALRPDQVVGIDGNALPGSITYESFISSASPLADEPSARPDDDAVVLYTSGSTSVPKGVRLAHRGMIENGFNIGERQGLSTRDRVFVSVPLFWAYGGSNALPASLTHGSTLVLAEKFEAESAIDMIELHHCTAIYTLPAMTSAILASPAFSKRRLASLRTGLTIGGQADIYKAARDLGIPEICNIYGSTETYGNCCVTWHHWPLERRASVQGQPLPGVTIRVLDIDSGSEQPANAAGMVEVGGYVSPGYLGRSAQTSDAFLPDGYYRTGDIGYLTPDGDFVFVSRSSEMVKRAGINVSPAEVEEIIRGHADVAQCGVVGVPSADRGEALVAWVIPTQRGQITPHELLSHCRQHLSKYKLPDFIKIVDALPLTVTGKLNRQELKRRAAEQVAIPENI